MTWSDFYLLCFLVGFSLSVLSFLAGAVHLHLPFKWHLPFHGAHHGGAGSSHAGLKGGTHLTRHSHLLAVVSLLIATVAGLAAGFVVFRFMVKLVSSDDAPMKSEDYRMEGSLGTISMPIRESGTGEIIFSLAGVRRCAGARSDDGKAIEKGAEVVIERYEKGIAYVKRWEEFTK